MGTPGSDIPINRFGLTEVSPSKPASVDVVLVHGLNGDPQKTWTSEKTKTFWPSQLLPPILEEEHARVLVYGYDADVTSFTDGVSKDKIHNHAEHLVAELAANRRIRRASERPIIFIAHSLGGLVVKRALIYSSEIRGTKTEHLRSIFVSTYGILFLGTPHKGSDLAKWGSRLERICSAVMPKKVVDSNDSLVNALKENNETLQNIDRQFIQIMSKFHIFFFHEAKPTDLKGTYDYVVDEESASPTVQDVERAGIQADHSHMCKFENDSAPGFDLVAEAVQRYSEEAPDAIKGRWSTELEERTIQKRAAAEELVPGSVKGTPQSDSTSTFGSSPGNSTSNILEQREEPQPELKDDATTTADLPAKPTEPKPTETKSAEPYFIVPPGFRANTFFVGLEKEYQELDRRLFDKRRQVGTAAVLLHGQAGGGKSHLARQYVNNNRDKFSGGIFWITAGSREERDHAWWNICQKVIARDKPKMCGEGKHFVETVKHWFEAREEWLIVFDGVALDKDEDATEMQQFVPDSKNSSIIYISRAKNLESKQRLLRPFAIRVTSLKEDDARKLLFKELRIRNPTEAEKRKGTELVKKIGGLPLAIDAICHRISDTHEPLAKFNIKSYSTDLKMGGTYNKILDDLQRLGHMEAWNLIHILCFFGQHIPVEMVHLGLKSLRHDNVEVKSSEDGGKPDLNTTFGILMRYALIERNEPDDGSMSSSRDSLVGPEPIDVLKVHSVVQKFCCDSLNGMNILPTWLWYAVRLFGYSFHQADVRIKQRPAPGRVSDYREYLTHGQRLWDQILHYSSNTQPLDDIQRHLRPIIDAITEEIQYREPSSSQESIARGAFQVSIFDRTSSSSDSAPSASEARTPDHRPSPLPLPDENVYGFPLQKPAIDSPASFGTSTPLTSGYPRIVGGSPRLPHYDDGYESDQETINDAVPMRRNVSDRTERPSEPMPTVSEIPPSPQAPTAESKWQTVPPRKSRKLGPRRDLGSFRPTPARAQVDRRPAAGSVAKPNSESKQQRPSSDAFASLSEVHQKSPSPGKESGISSFFHRRSSSKPESADTRPSWAKVAAGQARPLPSPQQPSAQDTPSPAAMIMDRGRPRESVGRRQGNPQRSPLASEFVPNQGSTYDNQSRPVTSQGLQSTATSYPPPPQPQPILPDPADYAPPPPLGPNPAPYPLYENISPPTRRPLAASDTSSPQPQPALYPSPPSGPSHPSPPSRASPNTPYVTRYSPPYPPPTIPLGYTSAPMSRNGSGQSHFSTAETEPPRYLPTFPPQNTTVPLYDAANYRDNPHYDPVAGTGGWSYPYAYPYNYSNPHQKPTSPHSSPGPSHAAMSRSSSGPGIALDSPTTGLGIVRFDPTSSLQFGEHDAISLEEARRRTLEHETRLRERDREIAELKARMREVERKAAGGDGKKPASKVEGTGTPYPDVNLIPTDTDEGGLQRMVEEAQGADRRPRGFSMPEAQAVGLR